MPSRSESASSLVSVPVDLSYVGRIGVDAAPVAPWGGACPQATTLETRDAIAMERKIRKIGRGNVSG